MERFYREFSDGTRLQMSRYQWGIDRYLKGYVQIIAQPGLTIYKV